MQILGLALLPIGIMLSIQHNSEKIEFYYLIYAGVPFMVGTWMVNRTGVKST